MYRPGGASRTPTQVTWPASWRRTANVLFSTNVWGAEEMPVPPGPRMTMFGAPDTPSSSTFLLVSPGATVKVAVQRSGGVPGPGDVGDPVLTWPAAVVEGREVEPDLRPRVTPVVAGARMPRVVGDVAVAGGDAVAADPDAATEAGDVVEEWDVLETRDARLALS